MTKEQINSFFKDNPTTVKGVTIKYHNTEIVGYFEFTVAIDKKDKYSFICKPSNRKIIIEGIDIEDIITNG